MCWQKKLDPKNGSRCDWSLFFGGDHYSELCGRTRKLVYIIQLRFAVSLSFRRLQFFYLERYLIAYKKTPDYSGKILRQKNGIKTVDNRYFYDFLTY